VVEEGDAQVVIRAPAAVLATALYQQQAAGVYIAAQQRGGEWGVGRG